MRITEVEDLELGALMAKAQQGDASAYGLLLSRANDVLTTHLGARLKGEPGAKDVLQETLLALHGARHTYDPSRSFASWMFSICEHRLIDHHRSARRADRHVALDPQVLAELAIAQPVAPRAAARETLALALDQLPTGQRQAVELLKLEGLSVKEAAQRLGTSESALKVAAHRGYLALKRLIGGGADEHQ